MTINLAVLAPSVLAGMAAAVAAHTARRADKLRHELAAARHAATHDQLTGLLNRAGLAHAWSELAPHRPTVAVIDLNGFKPINDQHGHAAGDLVLATLAGRLRGAVPGAAGRLGGDEFALILTGRHIDPVLRALTETIAAPVPLPSGVTVQVTASVGVAACNTTLAETLADGDAAMYRAKTTGAGVAFYDRHRDDHPSPVAYPTIRTRDLARGATDRQPVAV